MKEGLPAPIFEIADQTGKIVKLADFRGYPIVLFFYPRAGTSGCTIEAREFRDAYPEFKKLGVAIVGASPDTVSAQRHFRDNEKLPFQLLADEHRVVAESYGVMKEKNMYGRKVVGVGRTTILIDREGVVRKVLLRVKPEGHAQQVLRELKALKLVAG